MATIEKGDRVRLVPVVARTMMRTAKNKTDWLTREGTVIRRRQYTGTFDVQWDGRSSFDNWPPKALRVIEPAH